MCLFFNVVIIILNTVSGGATENAGLELNGPKMKIANVVKS